MKTIDEIHEKISRGEAVVLTAAELKQRIAEGEAVTVADVDVVTTGTFWHHVRHIRDSAHLDSKPGNLSPCRKGLAQRVPAIPGPCRMSGWARSTWWSSGHPGQVSPMAGAISSGTWWRERR